MNCWSKRADHAYEHHAWCLSTTINGFLHGMLPSLTFHWSNLNMLPNVLAFLIHLSVQLRPQEMQNLSYKSELSCNNHQLANINLLCSVRQPK